ncbi:putative type IV restriction endonuclease [Methanocella conradii HZ254]|uniref:site-specific DNA-methyltransferase (adenine-specific) n=1 Tax=Methanocella conradii (strain DSM 24694 / JCM 17849 / CGMCC 1.5162 / HZ254) TaxID=1041930 RepID=H8IB27_METCZ|nr:N-6 DNA methylase [Methanocella conradii]AFD01037.1 putative type IV restriction endonuclease [Methanocella conradii HZ254]
MVGASSTKSESGQQQSPATTPFEIAKNNVSGLVEKYNQMVASGRLKHYNEENTKKDFITPLFRYLGWDVENIKTPDEVTNEDKVSKGRVDYAFRINGIPKFFLEAKALNKGLNEGEDALQAINYAWHKDTAWAVLTDFKTLIIYNAEVKGKDLSDARFIILTCDQFIDQFHKLWWLSKPAFIEGLLDKEALSWGKKLRKTKVGDQLLQELMVYRELLSKDILKNNSNKNLSEEEIDEAVQRIIDRLIFIRTTEDRQIEAPMLRPIIREIKERKRGNFTKQLNGIYRYYDSYYNSKLFMRHLCEDLEISDEVMIKVVEGLYESKESFTNYDFSAIDADVLGNIYEQYLGHILRKTQKRAKIESKETHRKEQGIYYTPTYIVDYIVRNTVCEALKNKKPYEVDHIKILDMACGSGSFLIKAFDVLNEYYRLRDKDYAQTKMDIDNGVSNDTWKITRKSNILRKNLYGVDLDPKAVEIAQLNLLLKAAEFKYRLPDLQENIKCGNSILSEAVLEPSVKPESPEATKPFDWNKEFPNIIFNGGWDVIIGNPPYVRQEELSEIKPYLQANFESYHGMADLFVYFFERAMSLLKSGGYLGIIVSNKWLKAGYGVNLRKFLGQYWIEQFIDFGDLQVFEGATTYPCIIIIRKIKKPNPKIIVCNVKTLNFESLSNYVKENGFTSDQRNLDENGWNFSNDIVSGIISKINNKCIPLRDYVDNQIYYGIKTGFNEAYIIKNDKRNELIAKDPNNKEIIVPFVSGEEIKRYGIESKGYYIILAKIGVDISKYPLIFEHLSKYKKQLENRTDQGEKWYELRACSYYDIFTKPKIMFSEVQVSPKFTFDDKGYYANKTIFSIPSDDKQLLAILNSKMAWFLIQNYCNRVRGGYILSWKYLGKIPIPMEKSPELQQLAEKMLQLNERLINLKGKQTDERIRIEKEIEETDKRIDEIVYDLYGLNEEERQIVEESIK